MSADPGRTLRLAVIGDVHGHWTDADVEYFDDSDYDHVLFVGDIGSYRHKRTLAVARRIAQLSKPALLIPGNHDAVLAPQLLAEVLRSDLASGIMTVLRPGLYGELDRALSGVTVAGFSRHAVGDGMLEIIAGRPHSMGGNYVAFAKAIERRFGFRDMAASTARLCQLVDESPAQRLLFLAHNGPTGLGAARDDIWGCDFREREGDFGDTDLERAIRHAKARGKEVVAVIAGHMHHGLRGGGRRRWLVRRDGCLYVNAARVPRVFRRDGRVHHHYVRVLIGESGAHAEEVLVPAGQPGFRLRNLVGR